MFYLFLAFLYVAQDSSTNTSPEQLESPESWQTSTSSSHSFIMKKKQRTPEEGSRAICRMALIAALGKTEATTKRRSLTESSSVPSVQTEAPSLLSPDRKIVESSDLTSKLDESEDAVALEEHHYPPIRVFLDTRSQEDDFQSKTDARVSLSLQKWY